MSKRNSPPPKNTLTKEALLKEKDRLIENLKNIDTMSADKVSEFKAKVYRSTARDRVKYHLLKACNLRLAQIDNRHKLMATHGDMSDFN
jgi:hypothetical protein